MHQVELAILAIYLAQPITSIINRVQITCATSFVLSFNQHQQPFQND